MVRAFGARGARSGGSVLGAIGCVDYLARAAGDPVEPPAGGRSGAGGSGASGSGSGGDLFGVTRREWDALSDSERRDLIRQHSRSSVEETRAWTAVARGGFDAVVSYFRTEADTDRERIRQEAETARERLRQQGQTERAQIEAERARREAAERARREAASPPAGPPASDPPAASPPVTPPASEPPGWPAWKWGLAVASGAVVLGGAGVGIALAVKARRAGPAPNPLTGAPCAHCLGAGRA